MLADILEVLAPIAVTAGAFARAPDIVGHLDRGRCRRRLTELIAIVEKLPEHTVGRGQLLCEIDHRVICLAYGSQYPQRSREIVRVALVGALVLSMAVGYYLLLFCGAGITYLVVVLASQLLVMGWFRRGLGNFLDNDRLSLQVFEQLAAPPGLYRPDSRLLRKSLMPTTRALLDRATDVRDACHFEAMPTLEAVNAARRHFDSTVAKGPVVINLQRGLAWKPTIGDVPRRLVHLLIVAAPVHRWVLVTVVGPLLRERLSWVAACEESRVTRAELRGEVGKGTWLRVYYADKRRRILRRWQFVVPNPFLGLAKRLSPTLSDVSELISAPSADALLRSTIKPRDLTSRGGRALHSRRIGVGAHPRGDVAAHRPAG